MREKAKIFSIATGKELKILEINSDAEEKLTWLRENFPYSNMVLNYFMNIMDTENVARCTYRDIVRETIKNPLNLEWALRVLYLHGFIERENETPKGHFVVSKSIARLR